MLAYMLSRQLPLVLLLLLSAGCASAHLGAAKPHETAPFVAPKAPEIWERVAVVGASASAGFGISASMSDALELVVGGSRSPIVHTATGMFFLSPSATGTKQLEESLAADPTLVIALDFLFWFTYGSMPEAARLEFLEEGLAMLARFECPLVIGTIPDMSAAIGKMLYPKQVPAPETLEAVNERILAWALARGDVVIIPLPDLLANLKAARPFEIHGELWSPPEGVELLQWDQLHPTVTGLASVACYIVGNVTEAYELNVSDLVLDSDEVAMRLQDVIEEKRRARKAGRAHSG